MPFPPPDEKTPAGMNVGDIENLDNGLLKNLGGMRDQLNGKVGGNSASNPDAAWRAYKTLEEIKNTSEGDKSGGVKDDGKLDGFSSSSDAIHGIEAGNLQDYLTGVTAPSGNSNEAGKDAGGSGSAGANFGSSAATGGGGEVDSSGNDGGSTGGDDGDAGGNE